MGMGMADDTGAVSRVAVALRARLSGALAPILRHPRARVADAALLTFVYYFHRVLGTKFRFAPFGFDEHYFVWEGWSLSKGLVPYRDFQEFKPPMVFVVNALGIELYGLDDNRYRAIFTLLSVAAFLSLTVALLTRKVSRLLIAGTMALMINHYFDGGLHDSTINNAESLGLNFFLIGCAILLAKLPWPRTQFVLGGVVLALSPLSKEPLALPTFAAWVALLLLRHFESREQGSGKRFAIFSITGVLGVLGVWWTYMLATRSLGWYVLQLKLNLAYSKSYAYQLGWFPKNPAIGEGWESWRRLRETYVNAAHLGVFVPLFVAAIVLWRGRRKLIGVSALAAAAGALYAVTVGHGFAAHYYIMAMTGMFFLAVLGMVAVDAEATKAGPRLRSWVGLATAALAFLTLWPRFSEERDKLQTYQPQPPPVTKADVAFVIEHSKPEDRIWTLGEPLLYVYSDRLSAVREPNVIDELIGLFPGETDEERLAGERAELIRNRPKLVVYGDDTQAYSRKQRYIHALAQPFVTEFGYRKIATNVYERPD